MTCWLSELLDEDAKQAVLHLVDVGTLIQIKSVNRSWRVRSRGAGASLAVVPP